MISRTELLKKTDLGRKRMKEPNAWQSAEYDCGASKNIILFFKRNSDRTSLLIQAFWRKS